MGEGGHTHCASTTLTLISKSKEWAARLGRGCRRVGVCWGGGSTGTSGEIISTRRIILHSAGTKGPYQCVCVRVCEVQWVFSTESCQLFWLHQKVLCLNTVTSTPPGDQNLTLMGHNLILKTRV